MSSAPISRSVDLRKLADRGFELEIRQGYLLVGHIPYVTDAREVAFGTIVSKLVLAGDVTMPPDTHVVYFVGSAPCGVDGVPLGGLVNSSERQDLGGGLIANLTFSAKPDTANHLYPDYYEQITAYAAIVGGPASTIDPEATARTYRLVQPGDDESPFVYLDTATSRAEIGGVQDLIAHQRIGIVGVGGTGSYILDFVAKTPVREIHLFDGDVFGQHNAFRAPGATSAEALGNPKSEHWARVYALMRTGVTPHGSLDEGSVAALDGLDFVFVAMDPGASHTRVVARLVEHGKAFIDVGMGVALEEGAVGGLLRVTRHAPGDARVPDSAGTQADQDDYHDNVQIVELNALNAALAVVAWKKMAGFYRDLGTETQSVYLLDTNDISNRRA